MKIKNINEITLFRYLYCLDKRDLPQSILNWCNNIGSAIDSDRENAIRELSNVKGNCRNLVVFSKTFVDTMDKSYMKLYVVKQKCTTANVVIYSDISLFYYQKFFC